MTAFRGNAAWTGYDMISGHWYTGPGQVVVPTNFLTVTGTAIGDTVTVSRRPHQIPVRIIGEVFDTSNRGLAMLTDWQTLASGLTLTLRPTTWGCGPGPTCTRTREPWPALGPAVPSASTPMTRSS